MSKLHVDGLVPARHTYSVAFDDRDQASSSGIFRFKSLVAQDSGSPHPGLAGASLEIDLQTPEYGYGVSEYIMVWVIGTPGLYLYLDRDTAQGGTSHSAASATFFLRGSSNYHMFRLPIETDYLKVYNANTGATGQVSLYIQLKEAA